MSNLNELNMKKLLYVLLLAPCLFLNTKSSAQQQGMYSQYMFNGLALNPAYAGSHEALSFSTLFRKQWTGMKGSPSTQTFSAHSPLKKKRKVALGFVFSNDLIGVTKQINVNFAYAYRIPVGKYGRLSFGLQGGFSNYNNALTKIYLGDKSDPIYAQNSQSFAPVVGAGIYYYAKNFYAGLSSPQLISYQNKSAQDLGMKQISHYFITSGYVFDLSKSLKFKPNVLVKMVTGAPVQIDINANLLINGIVSIGASYRSLESISAILQLDITDQLRFGYAYDLPVGSKLGNFNGGSHEMMLNFIIPMRKERKLYNVFNPRKNYF